jgi:Rrf2 family transcriptional regulator, cysteine metabolism repressor
MKLSLRGEYAVRALMALAENFTPEVVRIQKIAETQGIPKRFLEQILNELKGGGFVESKRGIAGGYRLARAPERISLAAVVQHMEGSPGPASGDGDKARLPRTEAGVAQHAILSVLREAREAMQKVLQQVTLADLCERARQRRGALGGVSDYTI